MKLFRAVLLIAIAGSWLGSGPAGAGNSAAGTAKLSGVNSIKGTQQVTPVVHNLDCAVTPPIKLPPAPITGDSPTIPSKVVITNNSAGTVVPAGRPITYVVAGHSYVSSDPVALKYGDKFLIDFNADSLMACTATASF